MSARVTILDAVDDANLFAPWFREPATWAAWLAFLATLFALPLTPERLAIFQRCTGRTTPPTEPAKEGWLVCGRRAGKSFMLALIAVYLACFHDYRRYLAAGERGTVLVIATDRRQARVIVRYVRALLTQVPMLAKLVEREATEAFDLSNSVTIEVGTASFRTVRGYTIVAALCDELAFWPTDDSASPDYEVLDAIRPGMATIPGSMLLCASSPYARRGALFDAHHKHFAKDHDPILVWQADTRTMNPTVPQRVIDEAMKRDPASAAAEYGAIFRSDVMGFVALQVVEGCVGGHREMLPTSGFSYRGFVDPSGGSDDAMTLAIAHKTTKPDEQIVIDAVREVRPPFSPAAVVDNFAALLKTYRITRVLGDHYGGEFVKEPFRKHGISYEVCKTPKSDLFRDLLPLLNSGHITLPRHDRLIAQIVGLERRVTRAGKESIDHAPGCYDDIANAVAGCAVALRQPYYDPFMGCGDDDDPDGSKSWQAMRLWSHILRHS